MSSAGSGCDADAGSVSLLVAVAVILALVSSISCDLFGDPNSPDPISLDRHRHELVLRVRTINRGSDTFGFRTLRTKSTSLDAVRPSGAPLTRRDVTVGYVQAPLELLHADTLYHEYATLVDHFVGYQRRYGGDTSRISSLDRYGQWSLHYLLYLLDGVLETGDSVEVKSSGWLRDLPDTLRGDGVVRLDLTVDADGLLTWDSLHREFWLDVTRISVRQPQ